MLNISFLACTKVELWDLTVCIAVNGEKLFQGHAMTLDQQCPTSNLSELFSYTTMYLSYRAKIHTHTHTETHTHRLW